MTICNSLLSAVESADRITETLVHFFEWIDPSLCFEFVRYHIKHEISQQDTNIEGITTLFRGNTVATKSMTAYSKIVGLPFATDLIRRVFDSQEANIGCFGLFCFTLLN